MGKNLSIRKKRDTLSANQALKDIGVTIDSPSPSISPSASESPSSSISRSPSASVSPSSSESPSGTASPSASLSPSSSASPSASVSPSSSVSPSLSPSAGLNTVFSDLIHWWVKASDGNIYGFGNTGKVYKIDDDLYPQQVYDARERIYGASEWFSITGKAYLYFATDRDLHRKELPGLSNWNDVDADDGWPKNNLTSVNGITNSHMMREAGGSLIICNASKPALVGFDDSYTNEALQLIPGNLSKTIVERNGRSIFGTVRADNPSVGINGAIDTEFPLAQIGNDGEIFFADMNSSIPVKRFPGGGKVNPGGVCNEIDQANFFEWEQTALSWIDKQSVGNMALFGVYDADSGYNGIYSYGRKDKNSPFVLNLEHNLEVDEIGAIISKNGIVFVSYRNGSDFGVMVTDVDNKATATYDSLELKAPTKKPINVTPWKYAELFLDPLPSGCSVEFWYKTDKASSYTQALTADGDTEFDTVGGQKAVFSIGAEGRIFEYRIILNPSGNDTPEVLMERIYFD